ncbi:MAG: hypothetical protein JXR90_12980, partial [Spirochaetes bacterium]|nr:hypothetical protein [Spirochaetota bacterium]
VDATTITATTAAHAAGLVDVVITNNDGQTITGTNAYTYVSPAPPVPAPPYSSPNSNNDRSYHYFTPQQDKKTGEISPKQNESEPDAPAVSEKIESISLVNEPAPNKWLLPFLLFIIIIILFVISYMRKKQKK